jgi:hypothetical protein
VEPMSKQCMEDHVQVSRKGKVKISTQDLASPGAGEPGMIGGAEGKVGAGSLPSMVCFWEDGQGGRWGNGIVICSLGGGTV